MADDTTREPEDENEEQQPTDEESESASPADDDLDIDIDTAPVQVKRRGGGLVWLVLAILVVVAAAGYLWYNSEMTKRAQREAEAKAERIQTYEAQLDKITENIEQAVVSGLAGNVDAALAELEVVKAQLTALGTSANQQNDQQWATIAQSKKQIVLDAQDTIKEQHEAYQQMIGEQFGDLASKFDVALPAPADEEADAEATETEDAEATETAEAAEGQEDEAEADEAEAVEAADEGAVEDEAAEIEAAETVEEGPTPDETAAAELAEPEVPAAPE
jgi:hypothetical protein